MLRSAGTTDTLACAVGITSSCVDSLPSIISAARCARSCSSMPRYQPAQPCGSRSHNNVRIPAWPAAWAILTADVVLPTPPLILNRATVFTQTLLFYSVAQNGADPGIDDFLSGSILIRLCRQSETFAPPNARARQTRVMVERE